MQKKRANPKLRCHCEGRRPVAISAWIFERTYRRLPRRFAPRNDMLIVNWLRSFWIFSNFLTIDLRLWGRLGVLPHQYRQWRYIP